MKLVTYESVSGRRIGCIKEDHIIDLNGAYQALLEKENHPRAEEMANAYVPKDMRQFLQGGEESMAHAKKGMDYIWSHRDEEIKEKYIFPITATKLQAPIQNPEKIICVGLNYRDHIEEMGRELPTHPVIFAKYANTIIGPEDEIPLPHVTKQLDYEAELAFVIGRVAKNVREEDALDYVAGYTIANDVSARDLQMRTIEFLQGKTLDGSLPMGPWLVTKEEIEDPHSLDIKLSVNGEKRQHSNTKQLVFNVNHLVSFLSEIMTLVPGDIICTGTPGGVGAAREPQQFLQGGDVVRIEIEKIGTLENQVKEIDRW
ncbi:fumarylacetoacetate hydrolase family protein [Aliibacillus thermotolerans]|uniref:Fumarylacetoacetate hydrolase family protein n=1 Tax=Aliibacillus thermotolerans TaxID=1834418 RepID=A0ABW0U806_9BACI|nr:fumarylacetoacetate hydrolase family protein [Aliibacillus thermotolerans]MDA3130886.1 FAA hydrolase family protein [Aliibacillus thermotolerans]